MSFWHKLFGTLMPETFKDMEAESRLWMLQCPGCGHEVSIWDLGGIRYGAYSKGKRMLRRCRGGCGKIKWHRVYKKETKEPQGSGAV